MPPIDAEEEELARRNRVRSRVAPPLAPENLGSPTPGPAPFSGPVPHIPFPDEGPGSGLLDRVRDAGEAIRDKIKELVGGGGSPTSAADQGRALRVRPTPTPGYEELADELSEEESRRRPVKR